MVKVLSAGKLSSCLAGAQISAIQTCLMAEDEDPKQGLSQKMCCLSSLHDHLHRLVSEGRGTQDGSLTCSGSQSPLMQLPLLWGEGAQMSAAQNGVCPRSYVASAVRTLSYADWFSEGPGIQDL